MSTSLPNEFVSSSTDNAIRPWTNGFRSHNDPLATIILFSDGMNALEAQSLNSSRPHDDYINNLSRRVNSFSTEASEGVTSGIVDTPQPLTFGTVSRMFDSSAQEGDLDAEVTDLQTEEVVETIAGGKVPVFQLDGKNDFYGVFNNFSLFTFTEAHNQISKIHMNLGASWNVFFLGNSPNIYQFSGYFLDTADYPYYQEFLVAYEKVLSGRKAVENHIQTKLMVAGQLIDGYLLSVNVTHNASMLHIKEFQFVMLVKGVSWVRSNLIKAYHSELNPNSKLQFEFNGLSNIRRLDRQFHEGTIDLLDPNSTSSKTAAKTLK
jgi:hypothetical protein